MALDPNYALTTTGGVRWYPNRPAPPTDLRATTQIASSGATGATGGVGYSPPGGGTPYEQPAFNIPEFEIPEAPAFEYGEYQAPTRDVGRIEELRTKAAAPGVRAATKSMQRALLKEYRNPNLARLAMRDILGGHGEALSRLYGGAAQTAEMQYAPEFGAAGTAARMKYEAGYQTAAQKYQASWAAKREKAMADWRAKVEAEKRRYELELGL